MSDEIRRSEAPDQPAGPGSPGEAPEGVQGDGGAHNDANPLGGLGRDVAALVATVDQHSAELDTLNRELLIWAFAFGALAGLVFLHHRTLKDLTDAVAG